MSDDAATVLLRYLRWSREAVLWKLDGLSEVDARRPLTPTGTNVLGVIKHLAGVEAGYFGDCFGRPLDDMPDWFAAMMQDTLEDDGDMWATPEESRDAIVALYARAAAHTDALVEEGDLDRAGVVPWWGDDGQSVTLHWMLVHMIAETNRHGGHLDIVRELIDGAAGMRREVSNLPSTQDNYRAQHRARVQAAADTFA